MTTDGEVGPLFEVLGDELARKILAMTSVEPLSADALSDRCASSQPTVYRRLDELQKHDLLVEHTEYDTDGNHYRTYECRLEEVRVTVDGGSFDVDLNIHPDEADGGNRDASEVDDGV